MIRSVVGSKVAWLRSLSLAAVAATWMGCDGTNPVLSLPAGSWGGEGAEMVVSATGVTFDYNCAGGSTSVPPVIGENGSFAWAGTYTRIFPASSGSPDTPHPATYHGTLTGATIVVGATVPDLGIEVDPVTLVEGQAPDIARCP